MLRGHLCLPIDEAVMIDERATSRRRCVALAVAVATLAACAIWFAAGVHGEPRLQVAVDDALMNASAALVAKDPVAWSEALPTGDVRARAASQRVFVALTRFPLTKVWAKATPEGDAPGCYRVRFYGRVVGADTAPVLCERLLQFGRRGGRLTLVADRTEERLRAAYYLAFQDPVVRSRSHLVVIAERNWEWLIPRILACNEQTMRVARRFGLDSTSPQLRHKTIVYVSASRRQAWDASASRPHAGMCAVAVDGQIFIIGKWPEYWKHYTASTMRHELAHLYTDDFGDGKHLVSVLSEGPAVAAAGNRDFAALRTEVARGNHTLPLIKGLMKGDVWHGLSERQVDMAYLEAGALFLYLEKHRGWEGAQAFADAVTASDLTVAGIERATRRSLGISWGQLYAGWKRFVASLP